MSAIGTYNEVVNDGVVDSSNQYFTTPANSWFHYCLNWARSTNMIQIFVDGQLVRTGQTSSYNWRDLYSSGELWFNRLQNNVHSQYVFGGELYMFNIFSVVLSPESIKKIAHGGLCFPLDEFSDSRVLKWEDILTKSRTGRVTEIRVTNTDSDAGCLLKQNQKELNRTKVELEDVNKRLDGTVEKLETANRKLNQTEHGLDTAKRNLSTIVEELATAKRNLSTTVEELTTAKRNLSRTQEDLGTCSTTLTDTKEELAESRRYSNITKWDILYTSPYHNKILTQELIERLKSNWDVLSTFVGVNMTDTIVEHFRKHDVEKGDCDLEISDIFDMIDELVEDKTVKISRVFIRGLIRHFRENHGNQPCEGQETDREIS